MNIRHGKGMLNINISDNNFLYEIRPNDITPIEKEEEFLRRCLKEPVFSSPLTQQVKLGMEVAILVDDLTRPTPQNRILPILLDELHDAGIKDKDITVIIALGTHRYMTKEEITQRYGKEVINRVEVINHEWKNNDNFINLGSTEKMTPVIVNKRVYQADYVIGVGSIVPHEQAGWSGGAKIVQPGICSWETTGYTHLLAMRGDYLEIAGREDNEVRGEIERVSERVGLNFILNVILDSKKNLVGAVAGDPVKAQRKGIELSSLVYVREIPKLADIVILSSYPAELDYWQGLKALSYAQRGIKEGGTVIFVGPFLEGISSSHPDMEKYGDGSYKEVQQLLKQGKLEDHVCAAALALHALIADLVNVICVSEGMSIDQKRSLNFEHAPNIVEALKMAFTKQGKGAKIGIIDYGGNVLPKFKKSL